MIRGILILAFTLILNAYASAQLFQAPTRLTFANVNVKLDAGAQQIVQTDVYALLSNRTTLNTRLDRASLYFPIVENILSEEKVPNDFKYLVLQESGLAPDAVSTSNAVGFWQFKKETATDYGLRVDDEIDERKNIHASTRAAANYLKKNNTALNNWISTLYSYYLGLGGVRSLVPTEWNGANEITLTDKTDRYILRCLAHKLVYENELRGYRTSQTPFYEYKASGGKTFTQIADQLGVDEVELRRYNRWVGGSKIPQDRPYTMLVVVDNNRPAALASNQSAPPVAVSQTTTPSANRTATAAAARKAKAREPEFPVLKRITPPSNRASSGPVYYQINGRDGILAQDGDTYETIAKRADIRAGRFLSINDMEEDDKIVGGKVYYIQKKAKSAPVEFHTLQHGETAWDVSQMYGIRLSFLLRKNRIASATEPLQPGRVLWMKKRRPCKTAIEVVPLPEPEKAKEETPILAETPVTTSTPPVTTPATDVAVTVPTTPTQPQTNSGRVVLVDENGQVVSGNPSATRPVQPSTSQPVRTEPTRTQPEVVSRPVTNPNKFPTTPGEEDAPVTPRQPAVRTEAASESYHTVESGETFYAIARKYNMKPDELLELNGLKSYPLLKKGEKVLVKGTPVTNPIRVEETAVAPVREATPSSESKPAYHVVKSGETFFAIARKYNMKPEELRDLNGLQAFPQVNVGDRYVLRAGAARPATSSIPANTTTGEWRYHTVQQGETMFSIARQYDIKVDQIRSWNNMSGTDMIRTGQRLKIKNK
ncbi:hypothetical protein BWI96_05675 [Siphonobacter sp. SORGH_AS_0500]|uniref:LysM peptidoglycan-binding domain-containing protein n=1 Tax=Siphonobacter sp. SORGH_AS_0500 TaxID=1864824 RepID=UPI000CC174A4|nr:LysM peptidoglycan-binding domain-containing protein [Siphonobacter sp. SORGH_AS_0500]PKK37364.1 hypothetical protein BWI96_05675 [Siphonobacter sp. SORGH_AS_0500]